MFEYGGQINGKILYKKHTCFQFEPLSSPSRMRYYTNKCFFKENPTGYNFITIKPELKIIKFFFRVLPLKYMELI